MSQYSDIMQEFDDLKVQVSWLVQAMKYLLEKELGQPLGDRGFQAGDLLDLEADLNLDDDMSEFEHVAVRSRPKQPQCPHQHQVLVDGVVRCAKCGHPLNSSGLVRTQPTPSGGIMADPNPPQWATQYSPGASSKNPGTPLVPHTVD